MELAYRDLGRGFPILLIHGFCESKNVWNKTAEALSADFRVICPDLNGFGESPPPTENMQLSDYAEQIYLLIKKLGLTKVALVGHSLGGYVSLAFAAKYPDAVAGLCMFHSTAFADADDKKLKRNAAMDNIRANGGEDYVRVLIPNLFSLKNQEHFGKQIDEMIEEAKKITANSLVAALSAMQNRTDKTQLLKEAQFPVFFIVGKDDSFVPLADSVAQCYLPAESYVLFLGEVGHIGMVEAPAQTLNSLHNFLLYLSKHE